MFMSWLGTSLDVLHRILCAVVAKLFAFCSGVVHDSHADLVFEFGSPLLSRCVFSRLATLFYLVFDRLEAHVLKSCSRARNDKDSTVP